MEKCRKLGRRRPLILHSTWLMLSRACVRSCLLQGNGAAVIHPLSLAGNPCDQMASMKKLHDLDPAPRPQRCACGEEPRKVGDSWVLVESSHGVQIQLIKLPRSSSLTLVHSRYNTRQQMRSCRSNSVINVLSLKRENTYKSAWLMLGP